MCMYSKGDFSDATIQNAMIQKPLNQHDFVGLEGCLYETERKNINFNFLFDKKDEHIQLVGVLRTCSSAARIAGALRASRIC